MVGNSKNHHAEEWKKGKAFLRIEACRNMKPYIMITDSQGGSRLPFQSQELRKYEVK